MQTCNSVGMTTIHGVQRIRKIDIVQHEVRNPKCHPDDVFEVAAFLNVGEDVKKKMIAEVHSYDGTIKVNFEHVLNGVYYSNAEQQQMILDNLKSAVGDQFDSCPPDPKVLTWLHKLNALNAELGHLQRQGLVS